MSEHEHQWQLPEGGFRVIDTMPPQYPYRCECGAFTHNPATGEPCQTCAPLDYARRTTDLVALEGGPFDGSVIARPVNQFVLLRCADDGRAQKIVRYEQTENRDVWRFRWNEWTQPFEPREVDSRA